MSRVECVEPVLFGASLRSFFFRLLSLSLSCVCSHGRRLHNARYLHNWATDIAVVYVRVCMFECVWRSKSKRGETTYCVILIPIAALLIIQLVQARFLLSFLLLLLLSCLTAWFVDGAPLAPDRCDPFLRRFLSYGTACALIRARLVSWFKECFHSRLIRCSLACRSLLAILADDASGAAPTSQAKPELLRRNASRRRTSPQKSERVATRE